MVNEWNKLIEEAKLGMTPELLAKLKSFVEKETARELEQAEQSQWLDSREQILSSISLRQPYQSQSKESWYALIEHIRKRVMENNGKLAKTLIYSKLWSSYLQIGSAVAMFASAFVLLWGL